jgi:ribosomal protein L12E/L44/L45/RPP1/RPP2
MSHLITCLLFTAGGAVISGILVDLKWKEAAKKLFEKISSLEDGLAFKQSEINAVNSKLIAANSRINMMDVSLVQKDKELNELLKKTESPKTTVNAATATATTTAAEPTAPKKRGPYKKKRYGRPASNNNSGKKTE